MISLKNTADLDSRYKNLALSSNHKTYNQSVLLLQVSSYDFEPIPFLYVL